MATKKRAYRSTLRQSNAAATRERILTAAQNCFEELGYAGTTMRAISHKAGVSVEAVNLTGSKRQLLQDAFVRGFMGSDSTLPLLDHPEPKALFAHPDPIQALSGLIGWVADRNQHVSRIWHAFDQAADSDADTRAVYLDYLRNMRLESVRCIESLSRRKALRTDAPKTELADRLWIVALPDQHRRLCLHAGWSQERYRQWVVDGVLDSLLSPRMLTLWNRRKR